MTKEPDTDDAKIENLPQRFVARAAQVWLGKHGPPDLLGLAMVQGGIELLRASVGPGNWADDLEALAKWARETNPTGESGERSLN